MCVHEQIIWEALEWGMEMSMTVFSSPFSQNWVPSNLSRVLLNNFTTNRLSVIASCQGIYTVCIPSTSLHTVSGYSKTMTLVYGPKNSHLYTHMYKNNP